MRRLACVVAICLFIALPLAAKDVYLGIAGSVGVFRTDARILNPSGDKDITVVATFIPVQGNSAGGATVSVNIPKRQMRVLDDVVTSLFSKSGLGAIKLSSPDDFVATSRIYASSANGTLGQFVQGVDATKALLKGVVIQLKNNGTAGQSGTFRTNIGFVNVGAGEATISLRLHDRTGAVTQTVPITIPAGGAVSPTNHFTAAGDYTDGWASFESNQPLIAYGSVVDNGTTDPTFVPAVEDTGSEVAAGGPKIVNVSARQWAFSPETIRVKVGDTVTLRITSEDVTHGFVLSPYVTTSTLAPGQTTEVTFEADQAGSFRFFCTNFCGQGHAGMDGTFIVEP